MTCEYVHGVVCACKCSVLVHHLQPTKKYNNSYEFVKQCVNNLQPVSPRRAAPSPPPLSQP
jgi:hypothetical protein